MTPWRCLVVEDEILIRLCIVDLLEHLGLQVVAQSDNGEEAVRLGLEKKPELILMDIRLNGAMTGIEAAAVLTQHIHSRIIFMSAYDPIDLADSLSSIPYAGFLRKPVEENDLQTLLYKLDESAHT